MSYRSFIVAVAASAFLTGCGSDQEGRQSISSMQPRWEVLADGSSFAQTRDEQGQNKAATRCWPVSKGGFTCLKASTHSAAGVGLTKVAKLAEAELPTLILPFAAADEGYGCQQMLGRKETLSKRGQTLVTNDLERSSRWSRSYVSEFISANSIEGTSWFPCLEVLDAVDAGSLATLGSTAISGNLID